MLFEIVPDLLDGVELGSIARKVFQVKPMELLLNRADDRPAVYAAIVPDNDDVSTELPQKGPEESSRVQRREVLWLKGNVEAVAVSTSRDCEGSQCGNPVVTIVVANNRRVATDSPRPSTAWDEQKPTLIKEREVGTKSSPFFLAAATGTVSNARSPLRRVGLLSSPVLGNSSRNDARASKHGRLRTLLRIPSESPARSASGSTCRSGTPMPSLLEARFRKVAGIAPDAASEDGLEQVSAQVQLRHHRSPAVAIGEQKKLTPPFVVQPRRGSAHSTEGRPPFGDGAPVVLGNHLVS